MKTNSKKLALAGVLCAVAVVGSMLQFPVFGSQCAPVQHMVNVICAVFLGPGLRRGRGLPGQPAAQHLRLRQPPGLPRQYVRRPAVRPGLLEDQESARDPGGRGVRHRHHRRPAVLSCGGGLYGRSGRLHRLYAYVVPFLVSTVGGSILAGILVFTLQKSGALKSMRGRIGALIPTEKGSFHA